MKCTECGAELSDTGVVLTFVRNGSSYTATLDLNCLKRITGLAQARKLESVAFSSGWTQLGLPGEFQAKSSTRR